MAGAALVPFGREVVRANDVQRIGTQAVACGRAFGNGKGERCDLA